MAGDLMGRGESEAQRVKKKLRNVKRDSFRNFQEAIESLLARVHKCFAMYGYEFMMSLRREGDNGITEKEIQTASVAVHRVRIIAGSQIVG